MEPSDEVRQVITRFFEAMRDGHDPGVGNRLSRRAGFERFGSDPEEWWDDGGRAAIVLSQQMCELGGRFPWRVVDEVRAHTEGTVGWASVKAMFEAVNGDTVALGMTYVLHLEHGEWKIVQAHTSIPSPNADHGLFLSAQRIHQPVDDDRYIVVQVDFDTVEAAEQFKGFLESVVWQSRDLSPGLMGSPTARVLREAQVAK